MIILQTRKERWRSEKGDLQGEEKQEGAQIWTPWCVRSCSAGLVLEVPFKQEGANGSEPGSTMLLALWLCSPITLTGCSAIS